MENCNNKLNDRNNAKIIILGKIVLFWALLIFAVSNSAFADENELMASPNYLVILVHGIGDMSKQCFGWKDNSGVYHSGAYGDLYQYLEKDLGLEGYVYEYDIENALGSNSDAAKQIGDRINGWTVEKNTAGAIINRYNTCWLETAKNQYRTWYFNKYKGLYGLTSEVSVPSAVIPEKFVFIAHSMGGSTSNVHRISLSGTW
ncbi:MAG: hypothetical protein PHH14_03245 [Candidatus Margulisbacteria bacterium]|nr:hypothetical protein [Candidatus Margulisiibacteriota bacterium]